MNNVLLALCDALVLAAGAVERRDACQPIPAAAAEPLAPPSRDSRWRDAHICRQLQSRPEPHESSDPTL
jgi:hypothetical protein